MLLAVPSPWLFRKNQGKLAASVVQIFCILTDVLCTFYFSFLFKIFLLMKLLHMCPYPHITPYWWREGTHALSPLLSVSIG